MSNQQTQGQTAASSFNGELTLPSLSSQGRDTKIKNQLSLMSNRFVGFEEQLNLTREKKKDNLEREFDNLHNQIGTLKTALNLESKNRAVSLKALQKWLETRIETWTTKIEQPMHTKIDAVDKKLNALTDRIALMEKQRVEDNLMFPQLVDERAAQLLKEVKDIRAVFNNSEKSHAETHEALLTRLADQGKKLRATFESEKVVREKKLSLVEKDIREEVVLRTQSYEALRKSIENEIKVLHSNQGKEKQEREAADEDIVLAVNHYSVALHDAIQLVSEHP